MRKNIVEFGIFARRQRLRIIVYGLLLLTLIGGSIGVVYAHRLTAAQSLKAQHALDQLRQQGDTIHSFASLKRLVIEDTKQGITVTTITDKYPGISANISAGNYLAANQLIRTQTSALASLVTAKHDADAAAIAKKGTLSGTITDGKNPLSGVTVSFVSAGQTISTLVTPPSGAYSFTVDAGTFTLTAALANYTSLSADGIVVTAQQNTKKDVALAVIPPSPVVTPPPAPKIYSTPRPTPRPTSPPPPPTGGPRAYSTYGTRNVNGFNVTLMTFDLGSGHIKVMEDTADNSDCTNNCSVQSVMSFVQQNGAFAGINGSYFCPTAYSSCVGKTNSFYWKQYNSRLQKMINPNNTLGEQDPFIVFDANGHATFLRHWVNYASSGVSAYAGISCSPILVYNGQNVLDNSTLDSNQSTAKVTRAAIGLKGQTLYVFDVSSATVLDLGNVATSLGLDSAMNIDGGGSVGMVYNNSYQLGPGRGVPNALVFAER